MKSLLCLYLGCWSVASAAPPVVSNVRASQVPGTKVVDITYDLADPDGGTLTIDVRVSSDGGVTYTVPCTTLSGAVGAGVTVGTGKLIHWNAGADWSGNFMAKAKVRITAVDGGLPASFPGMAVIPAGMFQMGDTVDGAGSPTANIYIDQFHIDKTEVTTLLWDDVYDWAITNGFDDLNEGVGGGRLPVGSITWYDAVKWCNARSLKEGLVPCYYTDISKTVVYKTGVEPITAKMVNWYASGYRLPTEAEWEKAARGGLVNRRFPWGDLITHSQASYYSSTYYPTYDKSPTRGTHPTWPDDAAPVGSFPANGYGLYDMAGNHYEWTWDRWSGTLGTSGSVNPTGPDYGDYRVLRGGSWDADAIYCRNSDRHDLSPGSYNSTYGFRTVRR